MWRWQSTAAPPAQGGGACVAVRSYSPRGDGPLGGHAYRRPTPILASRVSPRVGAVVPDRCGTGSAGIIPMSDDFEVRYVPASASLAFAKPAAPQPFKISPKTQLRSLSPPLAADGGFALPAAVSPSLVSPTICSRPSFAVASVTAPPQHGCVGPQQMAAGACSLNGGIAQHQEDHRSGSSRSWFPGIAAGAATRSAPPSMPQPPAAAAVVPPGSPRLPNASAPNGAAVRGPLPSARGRQFGDQAVVVGAAPYVSSFSPSGVSCGPPSGAPRGSVPVYEAPTRAVPSCPSRVIPSALSRGALRNAVPYVVVSPRGASCEPPPRAPTCDATSEVPSAESAKDRVGGREGALRATPRLCLFGTASAPSLHGSSNHDSLCASSSPTRAIPPKNLGATFEEACTHADGQVAPCSHGRISPEDPIAPDASDRACASSESRPERPADVDTARSDPCLKGVIKVDKVTWRDERSRLIIRIEELEREVLAAQKSATAIVASAGASPLSANVVKSARPSSGGKSAGTSEPGSEDGAQQCGSGRSGTSPARMRSMLQRSSVDQHLQRMQRAQDLRSRRVDAPQPVTLYSARGKGWSWEDPSAPASSRTAPATSSVPRSRPGSATAVPGDSRRTLHNRASGTATDAGAGTKRCTKEVDRVVHEIAARRTSHTTVAGEFPTLAYQASAASYAGSGVETCVRNTVQCTLTSDA